MRARLNLAHWCLIASALSANLIAQNATVAFKVRGGIQAASLKDNLSNKLMGLGLEAGFALGPGHITGELGYQFKPGDEFRAPDSWLLAQPTVNGASVDPSKSVDSRKNKMDGMTLRLGYEAPLAADWAWRAGLQFGGTKFSHQYLGQISGTVQGVGYTDSYGSTTTKNSFTPSLYGGLTYHLNHDSSFEFGVLLLSSKTIEYRHVSGTVANADGGHTASDTLVDNNRILPHLEVAYVFRF